MLELLGLGPADSHSLEQVAILVGPNGAGKSNFLRKLALDLRHSRNLIVICNTAYDRFSGMRGIKHLSASRAGRSPKTVIKLAVADTLDREDGRSYQIAKILEYCGYHERIGFKVKLKRGHKFPDPQALLDSGGIPNDIDLVLGLLSRLHPNEILWVGERSGTLAYSQGREFASMLRLETALRRLGFLTDIQVFLHRIGGPIIELLSASSGELAIISSLLFLIASRDPDPVILVDEPENSLHPNWQREYVDKLLNALEYRSATVIIATHAPLIVTGALANSRKLVSVFQIDQGTAERVQLADSERSTESIEAILWRAFDVITPASHYVSEELVGVVRQVEQGVITTAAAFERVAAMDAQSFDAQQRDFFRAVRQLIAKVAAERGRQDGDG